MTRTIIAIAAVCFAFGLAAIVVLALPDVVAPAIVGLFGGKP